MFTSTSCTLCKDQWSNPLFSLTAHADLYEKGDGNSGEFSAGERKQACTHSFRLLSYKSSSRVGAADPDHPPLSFLPVPILSSSSSHGSFSAHFFLDFLLPQVFPSITALLCSSAAFIFDAIPAFYLSQFLAISNISTLPWLFSSYSRSSSCPFQPVPKCPRLE